MAEVIVGVLAGFIGPFFLAWFMRLYHKRNDMGPVEWTRFRMTCSKCGHTKAFVRVIDGDE